MLSETTGLTLLLIHQQNRVKKSHEYLENTPILTSRMGVNAIIYAKIFSILSKNSLSSSILALLPVVTLTPFASATLNLSA